MEDVLESATYEELIVEQLRGSADVVFYRRVSALGHINLGSLGVHREQVIGLAPIRGNPTPPQDREDYLLPNLH